MVGHPVAWPPPPRGGAFRPFRDMAGIAMPHLKLGQVYKVSMDVVAGGDRAKTPPVFLTGVFYPNCPTTYLVEAKGIAVRTENLMLAAYVEAYKQPGSVTILGD